MRIHFDNFTWNVCRLATFYYDYVANNFHYFFRGGFLKEKIDSKFLFLILETLGCFSKCSILAEKE